MSDQMSTKDVAALAIEIDRSPPEWVDLEAVGEINDLFACTPRSLDSIADVAMTYSSEHYARTSPLVPRRLVDLLTAEAMSLAARNTRRIDITVEATGHTPRRMSSLPNRLFRDHGKYFPALYYSSEFRKVLSSVSRNPVMSATYAEESITGTNQTEVGDTHGWHWGDHEFAWIFIAKAPDARAGGLLQSQPHTWWDKNDPRVNDCLTSGAIRTYHHRTGESYLFRTDTSLHRTTPLEIAGQQRVIVNLTFASLRDWLEDKSYETTNAVYEQ